MARLKAANLLPREILIDTLAVPTPNALPELMRSGESSDKDDLAERVKELAPWGYSIHLDSDVLTGHPDNLQRFIYRVHLIGNSVSRLTDVRGATVLDMACNHGYFALRLRSKRG